MADYFTTPCKYSPNKFSRRFRMRKELFLRILSSFQEVDPYFEDKRDGLGNWGVSGLQKTLSTIRQLAYGYVGDAIDEYYQIGGSTALVSLERFCIVVSNAFKHEYLRIPNNYDTQRLLADNAAKGFLGMLGSRDCMHWHSLFGIPGSNNDINVLHRSNLFEPILNDESAPSPFTVNGNQYRLGYYLADGIYPKWATIVQAIKDPKQNAKQKQFTMRQEAVRKYVERAFRVLQARFHIVKTSARSHKRSVLSNIMKCCIIMHNMIVENERDIGVRNWRPEIGSSVPERESNPLVGRAAIINLINSRKNIRNTAINEQLQNDLIEHIWQFSGTHQVVDEEEPIYESSTDEEDNS